MQKWYPIGCRKTCREITTLKFRYRNVWKLRLLEQPGMDSVEAGVYQSIPGGPKVDLDLLYCRLSGIDGFEWCQLRTLVGNR